MKHNTYFQGKHYYMLDIVCVFFGFAGDHLFSIINHGIFLDLMALSFSLYISFSVSHTNDTDNSRIMR